MTASVATYPHEVVRTRLQTQRRLLLPSGAPRKRSGIIRTTRKIIHFEGWRGLYKGLSVNLIRTVPNSAVTMLTCVVFFFCFTVLRFAFFFLARSFRVECWLIRALGYVLFPQIRIADAPACGAKKIAKPSLAWSHSHTPHIASPCHITPPLTTPTSHPRGRLP